MIYINCSFGYYPNMHHKKPTKFITYNNLAELVRNPSQLDKSAAPLLIPHNEQGKTKEHTNTALYSAIIIDFDDVSYTVQEGIEKVKELYQGTFLYYTTSRHLHENYGIRFKIIIPLNRRLDSNEHFILSKGASLLFGSDTSQANNTQGFYAPNTLNMKNYQGDLIEGNASALDEDSELFIQATAKYNQLIEAQQQTAIHAKPKPREINTNTSSIIELINQAYDIESLLHAHGYIKRGKCWLAPNSTSEMAGVHILDDKRVYSHHRNDPLSAANHDNHSLDVADVLCALAYSGDFTAMIKEEANNLDPQGQKERQRQFMKDTTPTSTSQTQEAEQLVKEVIFSLSDDVSSDILDNLIINTPVIHKMITNTLRMGNNLKCFWLLNEQGVLNNHYKNEAWQHMTAIHGNVIDDNALTVLLEKQNPKELDTIKKAIYKAFQQKIYFHIEHNNQRSEIHHSTDIFAQSHSIKFTQGAAILTYKQPELSYQNQTTYRSDVIAEYIRHFPELMDVINFLVAARFAPDRKQAYLWLHMPSNWGKSFFKSVLDNLNIIADISENEIKDAFKGKPVGLLPTNFIGKFALVVEEFKTVNSEMKQLENILSLAPKGLPACKVDIYAKLFFSAENVSSLTGSAGIEDQFANRFSYITRNAANDSPALNENKLFKELGSYEYIKHITSYTAECMNKLIQEYKSLEKEKAAKKAIDYLNHFHDKYAIDKYTQRLSKALPEISETFLSFLYSHNKRLENIKNKYYLQTPDKRLIEWIEDNYPYQEAQTLKHKKDSILSLISYDGTSKTKPISHKGGKIRALPVRKLA